MKNESNCYRETKKVQNRIENENPKGDTAKQKNPEKGLKEELELVSDESFAELLSNALLGAEEEIIEEELKKDPKEKERAEETANTQAKANDALTLNKIAPTAGNVQAEAAETAEVESASDGFNSIFEATDFEATLSRGTFNSLDYPVEISKNVSTFFVQPGVSASNMTLKTAAVVSKSVTETSVVPPAENPANHTETSFILPVFADQPNDATETPLPPAVSPVEAETGTFIVGNNGADVGHHERNYFNGEWVVGEGRGNLRATDFDDIVVGDAGTPFGSEPGMAYAGNENYMGLDSLGNLTAPRGGQPGVISGYNGDDIIFGDVLNTDGLATTKGIDNLFPVGSGWAVFEWLENNDPGWSRETTIEYIRENHYELARQSYAANGEARGGGRDDIDGGYGNDTIYGQEGPDVINGSGGHDVIFGGTAVRWDPETNTYDGAYDTLSGSVGDDVIYGDFRLEDQEAYAHVYHKKDIYTDPAGYADTISGGSGNDILIGGKGMNWLRGEAGADTFVMSHLGESFNDIYGTAGFKPEEGDVINVHHILQDFDPLADAITDFIHFTRSDNPSTPDQIRLSALQTTEIVVDGVTQTATEFVEFVQFNWSGDFDAQTVQSLYNSGNISVAALTLP